MSRHRRRPRHHRRRGKRHRLVPLVLMGWLLAFSWSALTVEHSITVAPASASLPPDSPLRRATRALRPTLKPDFHAVGIAEKLILPKGQQVVAAALQQVGKPYVWGAKGPNMFDCSGLVQWSWRQAGITLGPDTYTQITQGYPVTGPPQAGDLVFPARSMGADGPHHVVLAISATQAIEAPDHLHPVRVIPMPAIGAARRIV